MKVKIELKIEELLRARDNEEPLPVDESCKPQADHLWCEFRYQKDDNTSYDRSDQEKERRVDRFFHGRYRAALDRACDPVIAK
jgi:hypothetical protein